jgi:hypothetical protein
VLDELHHLFGIIDFNVRLRLACDNISPDVKPDSRDEHRLNVFGIDGNHLRRAYNRIARDQGVADLFSVKELVGRAMHDKPFSDG